MSRKNDRSVINTALPTPPIHRYISELFFFRFNQLNTNYFSNINSCIALSSQAEIDFVDSQI